MNKGVFGMYHILIVDDEPIVREGIRELIDWEAYNFTIQAEASDGRDGLEKIMSLQPELVLVDIKMPGLSGMDMICEARKQGFGGTFIILTGYSDFDYAKSAISLGVRGYLLKPIDEDELLEMIILTGKELNERKKKEEYFNSSITRAKKEVLRRLMTQRFEESTMPAEVAMSRVNLEYSCFCVVIAKYGELLPNGPAVGESLREEMLRTLVSGLGAMETVLEDDHVMLIVKGKPYEKVYQILRENNNRLKARDGFGFYVAVGQTVSTWKDLSFSYECAKFLLKYEFLYLKEGIVSIDILQNGELGFIENFVERLGNMIEVGDKEGIKGVLEQYEKHFKASVVKESEVKMVISQNMILLHNNLSKRYEESKKNFPTISEISVSLLQANSIQELIKSVYLFACDMSDMIGNTSSDNVIKRMYAYMEKNFDKDLKLENIAKMFNYNSAYLGKVFKKEAGESFNVALDCIRIENAKSLLQTTDMKVYQVSERVGFSNIDYFCAKFKKYVGVSPKEYKKGKINEA